ncbi:MAG: RNA polymerase sigma factor [Planctomycetota bacterium]|jgi:RNA polymerase sigma-70 factor (ECF subfamily)
MIEDRLLIFRCRNGSRAAFQRIYEKYESDLRTLAANLLDDKTAAEDVVQDVFVSLLKVVDKLELRKSLAGYLKTSVANRARDYLRKRQQQTVAVDDAEQIISNDDGPIRLVIQSEELKKLGLAMSRIPYEQREAVVLHLHGRMKFKTIAKLQNVSIKTAHTRYRAGLHGLKSILNSKVEK